MTTKRNQNSILVLATLGVYFGLVLVGATPQVLAQAATAKQFSVKDEVEIKDKLDTDPNNCSLLAAKVRERQAAFTFDQRTMLDYANVLSDILNAFGKRPLEPVEFTWDSPIGPRSMSEGKPVLILATWTRAIDSQVGQLRNIGGADADGGPSFSIQVNDDGFIGTLKVRKAREYDAHKAKVAFDTDLDFWRCDVTDLRGKLLLENTEVTWLDNQVFIVTRLPRAGLDALLAKDAK